MKKKEYDEENLRSELYKSLREEKSIDDEYSQISSNNFKTNQYLICKYNKTTSTLTPNVKHRKYYI